MLDQAPRHALAQLSNFSKRTEWVELVIDELLIVRSFSQQKACRTFAEMSKDAAEKEEQDLQAHVASLRPRTNRGNVDETFGGRARDALANALAAIVIFS